MSSGRRARKSDRYDFAQLYGMPDVGQIAIPESCGFSSDSTPALGDRFVCPSLPTLEQLRILDREALPDQFFVVLSHF